MSDPQIFKTATTNILSSHTGIDKSEVDNLLTEGLLGTYPALKCIVCSQSPHYQLIPRDSCLATEQLAREGYACKHCVGLFDPSQFRLRELKAHGIPRF